MTYTAYLIDPKTQTVTEVEADDQPETIWKLLECETFQGVYLEGTVEDMLLCDDEGKFNGQYERVGGFRTELFPGDEIAGRGLVVGTGPEGEGVDPEIDIESVRRSIDWIVFIPIA